MIKKAGSKLNPFAKSLPEWDAVYELTEDTYIPDCGCYATVKCLIPASVSASWPGDLENFIVCAGMFL
jgi:hypothetical protein